MKTKITQNIKAIILGLVIAVGAGYVSAWTAPTLPPTGGNVAAPINVGGGVGSIYTQTKSGILNLAHLITSDLTVINSDATPIVSGQILTADGTTGKVKWGAATGGSTGGTSSYAYYCFSKANWGASNGGVMGPVCVNAGGTQGFCPVGFKQQQDLGVWGRCHYNGGFTLPAGGTCDIDYTPFGNAYLCSK